MNRRSLLRAGGLAATTGLSGCLGRFSRDTVPQPPLVDDRPAAVYYPTHVEGMEMVGTGQTGDRRVGLFFSYAHRFWTVTGTRTEQVSIQPDDSIHLMASVWDNETRTVLPVESGVQFRIRQDGELVDERAPWPMLSQPMGFHFGDNVALPGGGTYQVAVDVGAMSRDRRGGFEGKFGESGTVEFEFDYSRAERDEISFRQLADRQGRQGAVSPMRMEMLPLSRAPATDALPGTLLGTPTTGDALFAVTATAGADGTYLAVCPRTPHNRFVLPMMSLSATVTRDGSTVFDGPLHAALDPERNYHYGVTVDALESGDEVAVTVDAPPQVSRHEGYETAFIDMPPVSVAVP